MRVPNQNPKTKHIFLHFVEPKLNKEQLDSVVKKAKAAGLDVKTTHYKASAIKIGRTIKKGERPEDTTVLTRKALHALALGQAFITRTNFGGFSSPDLAEPEPEVEERAEVDAPTAG